MENTDFLMEKRLRELNPELHRRYSDAVFALQHLLSDYRLLFPGYTDHSDSHSLIVADFCNRLIGEEQIENLNADEIFILLMSCYLHDVGMGISARDFEEFSPQIDGEEYRKDLDPQSAPRFVRHFHHIYSGLFVHKYASLFDLPSYEYTFAIAQVCKGHRKIDLFDKEEYPANLLLPDGNTLCLPYLAAVLRLADEIDVTADRNPELLFDLSTVADEYQQNEYAKHRAVRNLIITPEAFVMDVKTSDEAVFKSVMEQVDKMQETLDYCAAVVRQRTPHEITQTKIVVNRL